MNNNPGQLGPLLDAVIVRKDEVETGIFAITFEVPTGLGPTSQSPGAHIVIDL